MVANGTPIEFWDTDLDEAERDWTERRLQDVPHEQGVLFRIEAVSYASFDADGDCYGSTPPRLELFGYPVRVWTEYGATLEYSWSGARRRWVDLRPGAKQWASRTAREAVEQFALRRKRQLYVLKRQLARAERELHLTDHILADGPRAIAGAPVIA